MIGAENFGDFGIDGVPSARPNDLRFKDWRIGDGPQKPVAAYSFRRLNKFATRSMRVRRVADDAIMDLGFIMDEPDLPALVAFSNGGDVAVVTLFDQMGNGHDFTQTNNDRQPLAISSGNPIIQENRPVVWFDGVDDVLICSSNLNRIIRSTAPFSIGIVYGIRLFVKTHDVLQSTSSFDQSRWKLEHPNNSNRSRFSLTSPPPATAESALLNSSPLYSVNFIITEPKTLYINNFSISFSSGGSAAFNAQLISLGARSDTLFAAFLNFNELLFYDESIPHLRRQIEFNQSFYYSIALS